jgi:hypothetical protein
MPPRVGPAVKGFALHIKQCNRRRVHFLPAVEGRATHRCLSGSGPSPTSFVVRVDKTLLSAHSNPNRRLLPALYRGAYLSGVAPFVIPFVTTYSINDYSGINSRDSEILRPTMHEGMREGFTSADGTVEAWYMDSTLQLIRASGTDRLSVDQCHMVGTKVDLWRKLESQCSLVNIARRILNSAPMIHDMAASILQIWQGIQSLFPTVTTEVSVRLALLVAQLCQPIQKQGVTYKQVRSAYSVRSKITHGAASTIDASDWSAAWALLSMCLNALIVRQKLPSEKELMAELLPE